MEYSQLINRLLDAEQSAQAITQEVKGREESMASELARESAELRDTFFARAEERIKAVEAETEASKAAALAALDKRRDEAMQRMERACTHYGNNWVDTLFHQVAGDQT